MDSTLATLAYSRRERQHARAATSANARDTRATLDQALRTAPRTAHRQEDRMPRQPLAAAVVYASLVWSALIVAAADAADDRYLAGYAAAILERQLELPGRAVTVSSGVLTVDLGGLDAGRRDRILAALSSIPGVVEVRAAGAPSPPGPSTTTMAV